MSFAVFRSTYLLVSKYFSCKWNTGRLNISKTLIYDTAEDFLSCCCNVFLEWTQSNYQFPSHDLSLCFSRSNVMFWEGTSLQPPVPPEMRRENCSRNASSTILFPKFSFVSCQKLFHKPSHNNTVMKDNRISSQSIWTDVKPTLSTFFQFCCELGWVCGFFQNVQRMLYQESCPGMNGWVLQCAKETQPMGEPWLSAEVAWVLWVPRPFFRLLPLVTWELSSCL